MQVRHIGNDVGGTFVAQKAGRRIGELSYVHRDGRVVMNHTWVDPRLRGQGLAGELLTTAMSVAQTEQWDVVPECSYIRHALRVSSDRSAT